MLSRSKNVINLLDLNGALKVNHLKSVLSTLTIACGVCVAVPAHAGGFFGDLINTVAPGVGTTLDQLNARAGNPVDHAAAAAIDGFVPGAGQALEAGWAIQRSGLLNGIGQPAAARAPAATAGYVPPQNVQARQPTYGYGSAYPTTGYGPSGYGAPAAMPYGYGAGGYSNGHGNGSWGNRVAAPSPSYGGGYGYGNSGGYSSGYSYGNGGGYYGQQRVNARQVAQPAPSYGGAYGARLSGYEYPVSNPVQASVQHVTYGNPMPTYSGGYTR